MDRLGGRRLAAAQRLAVRRWQSDRRGFMGGEAGGQRGLIGEVVIARDAGVPLFEPPDRLMHLGRVAQAPLGDARLEFLEIAEEALLVLGADRAIFLGAALTAAQEMDLPAHDGALD